MRARLLNLTGIILVAGVILLVTPLTVPKLFGYRIYGILTGSMEPEYPAGSIVYVREAAFEDIRVGDTIPFRMGSGTDLVGTHRVAGIDTETQQFITKGDANRSEDVAPVSYSSVIGRVVFGIPLLGKFSSVLHSTAGILACAGIFALAILLWWAAEKMKKKENAK